MWLHQQQLGKLSNSKHLWATPPHYHHEHNVRIFDIRAGHEQKAQGTFYTPQSAPDSRHGCHNAKPRTSMHYPHPRQQQHHHVEEPCLQYSTCHLPAMCHPNTPTKTHSCNGWEQTTPDANQRPVNVIPPH